MEPASGMALAVRKDVMDIALPAVVRPDPRRRRIGSLSFGRLEEVNKELWVVLTLFSVCLLLNYLVSSQRMVLAFYTFPTVISAYAYGRRHATLTALASVLLVGLMTINNPEMLLDGTSPGAMWDRWLDITSWGGTLIVTGYLMGTLYEHKSHQVRELRDTYHGVLMILRHFISNDKYTENHSYRVSVYAAKIASRMDLGPQRVEDVRAAALLHDIGKLEISRDLLYKAAKLTKEEFEQIQQHVDRGVEVLESHLPHGSGPSACLHLMSLMSLLDERTALVDLAWLSVPTVEVLSARGFDLVPIAPEERERLACNVLALGARRLLALDENAATNARLRARGFDVVTFPGGEICRNGSGGPTCLTRPLLRG